MLDSDSLNLMSMKA